MNPIWKNLKFWALVAVAVSFSIVIWFVRELFDGHTSIKNEVPGFKGLPPAPAVIQQAAETAHEEALQVKAESKAVTEVKKQELADITKVEDGRARRAALAKFVATP